MIGIGIAVIECIAVVIETIIAVPTYLKDKKE